MPSPTHPCPVCGYPQLAEPAFGENGEPSFEICPSCGTEFGYDDDNLTHDELRRRWLEAGAQWWSSSTPPPAGWDPHHQLEDAGLKGH